MSRIITEQVLDQISELHRSSLQEGYNESQSINVDNCIKTKSILTREDINKMKIINETIWKAMLKIIELDGYSDLTLNLEGSYYDIRDLFLKDYVNE